MFAWRLSSRLFFSPLRPNLIWYKAGILESEQRPNIQLWLHKQAGQSELIHMEVNPVHWINGQFITDVCYWSIDQGDIINPLWGPGSDLCRQVAAY